MTEPRTTGPDPVVRGHWQNFRHRGRPGGWAHPERSTRRRLSAKTWCAGHTPTRWRHG